MIIMKQPHCCLAKEYPQTIWHWSVHWTHIFWVCCSASARH